jgi:hypothetical protein
LAAPVVLRLRASPVDGALRSPAWMRTTVMVVTGSFQMMVQLRSRGTV